MEASEEDLRMENQVRLTNWNPWKLATIGIAVVITTALVTSLVVANWSGNATPISEPPKPMAATPGEAPRNGTGVRTNRAVPKHSNGADVLEKAVIGGALGAGVGAAGGAIAGGGKGAGKGAAIGGIVGATAGTLYGLHEK
jgi:hypothetical protein